MICESDGEPCLYPGQCSARGCLGPVQQQQSPSDRLWELTKAAQAREAHEQEPYTQDDLNSMQQAAQAGQAEVQELLQQYNVPNWMLVTERPEQEGAPMFDLTKNPSAHTHLEGVLKARGERYGAFEDNAMVAQAIKVAFGSGVNVQALADDQWEALSQIATKISRIVTGDPDYVDNWDDIAGYAKLVADRLRGVA